MINEKQSMYLAVIALILATVGIGMAYYKTEGPIGLTGPAGPAGTAGAAGDAGPQGAQGIPGVVDASYVTPGAGINVEVTDVEIDSDGITHVTMTVTDASGQPMSSDDFSMSFMLPSSQGSIPTG